jgi:hypothetical protein
MLFKISLLVFSLVILFSTNAFASNTVLGVMPVAKVYTYKHTKVNIPLKSGKFKGCMAQGVTYMSIVSQKALVSINKVNCANKFYNRKGFALFSRKTAGLKVLDIKSVKVGNKIKVSGIVKKQNINLIILN